MKRLLPILALLLVAGASQAVTSTALVCTYGGTSFINKNTQFATVATEANVVVTVSAGHPVTIEFSDTAAWNYRSTTADSTTDKPIAASQPYRVRFTQTTTFYVTRQSADGTAVATPLLVE